MPKLGRTTPCPGCPWLRKSWPGYLGADTPEHFFRSSVPGENLMPCHMTIDYDGDSNWRVNQLPDADLCAGGLIFFRNFMKTPRRPVLAEAVSAVRKSVHVFTWPWEFFAHHAPDADDRIVFRSQFPPEEQQEAADA
jgi:hypothetical protein